MQTEILSVAATTPNLFRLLVKGSFALAVAVLTSPVTACAQSSSAPPESSSAARAGDIPELLATVGDERITLADVRALVGPQLDQIETQYLRARSQAVESALESILLDRVVGAEARRQGKTIEDLIAAEAGPGALNPNEVEIAAWYEDNRARVGGRSLDQVRPQIANFLRERRRKDATDSLMQRLNREYRVAVNFQPYRLTFNNEGAPALGKQDAPVTVVEFSDFQCPYCQRFAPTLKRLAQDFGDQVNAVYRQFPIVSIHPNAFKAAEASLCAHEQGKFWELHDLMFAEQNRLAVTDLKEKARRLGLNFAQFESCLDTGRFTEQVQRDFAEGQGAGVSGTPAVFVNGSMLPGGAVPYETIAAAVQRELDRLKRQ